MDRTVVDDDPAYGTTGEEANENFGDEVDIDNIDQEPVYDGQLGEKAVKDPADELDIDNRDQIEVEDS